MMIYEMLTFGLDANKLTLNILKAEFMLIASKRKLKQFTKISNIIIGRYAIEKVTKEKVLGVFLDEELKWNEHNDAKCEKVTKSISLLKKAKRYVSQNALINIYISLVLPHFTYCSNVWNDGNRAHIDKLYTSYKRGQLGL